MLFKSSCKIQKHLKHVGPIEMLPVGLDAHSWNNQCLCCLAEFQSFLVSRTVFIIIVDPHHHPDTADRNVKASIV